MSEENAKENQLSQALQNQGKKTKKKGPYVLGPTLGEGAFAKVKVATQIHTKEKAAIKILDKSRLLEDENDILRFKKEISILKKLRHKNIIQLYEVMESKKSLYIVMEYCEGGELFDYIVKKKQVPEMEACQLFQQIINGVEYLHGQNIIHRDLKPENLLLDYNKNIKISDFGLSTFYDKNSFLQTPCGTPSYAPPEMLKGDEYIGTSSDVWSCGIILYAMLCGSLPFSESKEDIICQKIMTHDYSIPNHVSPLAQDLINHIMKINPRERYNIEKIKKHPWFNLITPRLKPGLSIGVHKIPIDENILNIVEQYGFDRETCRENLLNNKYCPMTCVYYLCVKKFVREGGKSVSDLGGELFEEYINNKRNLILSIDNDRDDSNTINNSEEIIENNNINETEAKICDENGQKEEQQESIDKTDPAIAKSQNNPIMNMPKMPDKEESYNNFYPHLKNNSSTNNINNFNKNKYSSSKGKSQKAKIIKLKNDLKKQTSIGQNSTKIISSSIQIKPNIQKNKNKQSTGNLHLNNNNFQTIKNSSTKKIQSQMRSHISAKQPIKKGAKENVISSMEISNMIKKKIKEFSSSVATSTIKDSSSSLLVSFSNPSQPPSSTIIPVSTKSTSNTKKNTKNTINVDTYSHYTNNNKENYSQSVTHLNSNRNSFISHNNSSNSKQKQLSQPPQQPVSSSIQRENYKKNRNDAKENKHSNQHKSSPFPNEQFTIDKEEEDSLFFDEGKPYNVVEYIAKCLVARSFCGSFHFPASQSPLPPSPSKEDSKEPSTNLNGAAKNDNSTFKNFVSILHQKYKTFLTKDAVKDYKIDKEDLNSYYIENGKNSSLEVKNNKKKTLTSSLLNSSKQYKNDNSLYDYIPNPNAHYNKFLDISTNYDPGLDSRGESSVERSLSIKSNELRNFSFSPETKLKSGNSQRVSTLNSSFNGNKSSSSLNKVGNIGVISEDEEYKLAGRGKLKNFKKHKFYQNAEKKVTINLSMSSKNSKSNTNSTVSKNKKNKIN